MLFPKYGQYLLKLLPVFNFSYQSGEFVITIPVDKNLKILTFLKNHTNCQYKIISDICAVDYISRTKRFEIIYNLLSIRFNSRIKVKILLNELQSIESVTKIFSAASWYEREIWDMFGIFFYNHPDLRRILTDYGFEGHPLRKDFPLSGFLEVRYDESKKRVVYENINLAQEYRFFKYENPWVYQFNKPNFG